MAADRSTRYRELTLLVCFAAMWATPDALQPQAKESASAG
jgi:hypothetical protein